MTDADPVLAPVTGPGAQLHPAGKVMTSVPRGGDAAFVTADDRAR